MIGIGPVMSSQPSVMGSQYGYPQMQQHMAIQPQYVQAALAISQQQSMQQAQAASQSVAHAGSDVAHQAAPPTFMAAPQSSGWSAQSQGQGTHYAAAAVTPAQSSIGQPMQQQVTIPGVIIIFSDR